MLTSVFVIVGVAIAAVVAMFAMGWWLDRYHSRDEAAPEAAGEGASPLGEEDGVR